MAEDFNKLRLINKQLVSTQFQNDWLFRLEIEGAPDDFDFYVKDISYNPREMGTDEEAVGAMTFTWPTSITPVKVTATMRDNEDGRIMLFMSTWFAKVVKPDGTVGLPYGGNGYLKKVGVKWQKDDGSELGIGEWKMYPTSLGEHSHSRENCAFLEFPVSLIQFQTVN